MSNVLLVGELPKDHDRREARGHVLAGASCILLGLGSIIGGWLCFDRDTQVGGMLYCDAFGLFLLWMGYGFCRIAFATRPLSVTRFEFDGVQLTAETLKYGAVTKRISELQCIRELRYGKKGREAGWSLIFNDGVVVFLNSATSHAVDLIEQLKPHATYQILPL